MTHSPTIVVADDDRELQWAMALRLTAAGYQVHTAEDGEAALGLVRELRPDALVLDVRMPRLSGLEVLRELQQRLPTWDLPVVIVSASVVDEESALDAGAACFVRKPYHGNELLQAVAAAMHHDVRNERN